MSIEECCRSFLDVPPHIIIKTEALRQGVYFSPEALGALMEIESPTAVYRTFAGDQGTTTPSRERLPHVFSLEDGTIVPIHVNIRSPYYIHYQEREFFFADESGTVAKISFFPSPSWLHNQLEDGTFYQSIAHPIGTDKIFCDLNHYCEYWKFKKQCLFCYISSSLQTKRMRDRGIVIGARPEKVAKVLGAAFQESGRRHLILTGGTVISKIRGKGEVSFYCDYLNAIREAFGGLWWSAYFQIGARPREEMLRIKETGIPALHQNMEVWDRNLFHIICPGKSEVVGWEEWQRRMFDAVELFGKGRIFCNFVAGVEMAQPFGFKTAREAVKSTLEGFDYLMSHGVLPRKDYWTQAEGSALKSQKPPPLEYYIELERGYLDLRLKHGFPFPFVGYCRGCTAVDVVADWDYYFVKRPELTGKQTIEKNPSY